MSPVQVLALIGLLAVLVVCFLACRHTVRRLWGPRMTVEVREALSDANAVSEALWHEYEAFHGGGGHRGR